MWLPSKDKYDDDDILLRPDVFDVGDKPVIHPNFFNDTLNDSLRCPYINDDPISNTQVFHHALLKSSMRKKRGEIDNYIKHYNALWCKLQQMGIHRSTNYFQITSSESLQLLLSNSGLKMIYQSTIDSINLELIFAQQIQWAEYSGNTIKEVCNINRNLYIKELDKNGNESLVQMCLQLVNLQ